MSARAIPVRTTSGVLRASTSIQRLEGFSVKAVGGATAFNLREGSSSGTILLTVLLADGASTMQQALDLAVDGDIYWETVTSGSFLSGSIWVA